mmetsp:Transcript_10953/g.33817  ORF Transcript_10953/g.33817 Transcript_10953/m.33817 type:complete len:301 (-) Transcript_10953:4-906(-)
MAPIGRPDVLDAALEAQLSLLTDEAAVAYANYVRAQPGQVLWGLGPNLRGWLLEGLKNGEKAAPAPAPAAEKAASPRSRDRRRSRSRSRSRTRKKDDARPVYDDDRVCRKARDILKKLHKEDKLGRWELEEHTVTQLAELSRSDQVEICVHFADFPRQKIKNVNGWMMGGIRRLQGEASKRSERRDRDRSKSRDRDRSKKRSRSRSRGRRRRSRSRSRSGAWTTSESRPPSPARCGPKPRSNSSTRRPPDASRSPTPPAATLARATTRCAARSGSAARRRRAGWAGRATTTRRARCCARS